MLHLIFLGVGKAFAASAVCLLARRNTFSAQGSLQSKLSSGYAVFRSWLAARKLYTSMGDFSLSSGRKFPDFRMKAYDCKLLLQWLAAYTSSVHDFDDGPLLATAAFLLGKCQTSEEGVYYIVYVSLSSSTWS